MSKQPTIPEVQTISVATLKLIAHPLRARLLGLFAHAPATVQELAAQLNTPVTRLYYHVHKLETNGLIRVIDSHPTGGTIEKVYAAAARQFIVDRAEFAGSPAKALKHAEVLIDVALTETGKAIQKSVQSGAIDLQQTAPHPRALQIRRGSGRISQSQARQFYLRLEALVEEFTSLEVSEKDRAEYMLAFAFFPTLIINKDSS
jgi:hypothetical protein